MQVVLERIDAGGGDVGIGVEVEDRVELRQRADAGMGAVVEEMGQQGLAGWCGVAGTVPGQVEMRRRCAALRLATADVVQQRIEAEQADIGILPQIPLGREIRVGQPPFARAMFQEMPDRVDARGVGIGAPIPGGVYQAAGSEFAVVALTVAGRTGGLDLAVGPDAAHWNFVQRRSSRGYSGARGHRSIGRTHDITRRPWPPIGASCTVSAPDAEQLSMGRQ